MRIYHTPEIERQVQRYGISSLRNQRAYQHYVSGVEDLVEIG